MLIILTGSDSINKRLIARQIMAKCNEYTCDGYKLDFSMDDPFGIINKDGKYFETLTEFYDAEETNNKCYESMMEMYNSFLKQEDKNHFYDVFLSVGYDLGIFEVPEYLDRDVSDFKDLEVLNELIARYKKSKLKYFVISGSFSKSVISRIMFKLGKENVKVINIIRNPSVAYFLNKKPKKFYLSNKKYTESYDVSKLQSSIINSMILKEDENVQSIRFEDMIETSLIIDDIDVGLYIDYNNKNKYLTTYEFDSKKDKIQMTEEELKAFNNLFSSFNVYDDMTEEEKKLCNKFDLENINVFERLGYEQLTIEEMCSL